MIPNYNTQRIVLADDVLHVGLEMVRYGPASLIDRRIIDAAIFVAGYVHHGVLSHSLAFETFEYELPLLTPRFQHARALLEQGFQIGLALALPLQELDDALRAWCAGEPPTPDDLAHLLTTAPRRRAPRQNRNFTDPWLGERSQWHGVPLGVRRVTP